MPDTGFDMHVDMLVDLEGERPNPGVRKVARYQLASHAEAKGMCLQKLTEKWINVAAHGYEKDWMWVIGARFSNAPSKQVENGNA